MPAKLTDTGCDIDGHVRKLIQVFGHVLQVFGEVADMQGYKLRLRMPLNHSVARRNQLGVAGEVFSVERPVRMIIQFLISFIKTIGGVKKSDGV